MQLDIKINILQNPDLRRYLSENSYWYKYLNRDGNYLKVMYEEVKKKYKLAPSDKLERVNNNIKLVSEMIKILK